MKKLKLDLIKQSSIRLTSNEANTIKGGGYKNSNNNLGQCRYSRKHPEDCETGPAGEICGCVRD